MPSHLRPIPGHYLATQHTRQWWKEEHYYPNAADVLTYPEWEQAGKKDCINYAEERMEAILNTHKISLPLTKNQISDIGEILNEAREFYRKRGMISDNEWSMYQKQVLKNDWYPFS